MRLVLSIAVVIVALMVSNITPASAGGGHLHGYSGGHDDGGEEPVVLLGNDAIANLAIKTLKVSAAPPIGARLSGVIERLPDGIVTVSAPTGGAITKVSTRPGESVKRGQAVAFFSPFQVGAGAFPLLAPIDGVVASIGAPLGAGREAGTVLFTVIDAQRDRHGPGHRARHAFRHGTAAARVRAADASRPPDRHRHQADQGNDERVNELTGPTVAPDPPGSPRSVAPGAMATET